MEPRAPTSNLPRLLRISLSLLAASLALFFLPACAKAPPRYISVTIGDAPMRLLVAATPAQRRQGYFTRPEPRDGEGIIFVYDEDEIRGFIMSRDANTVPFDLGIAFLSAQGVVLEVGKLKARDTEVLHSSQPFRYAVEGAWPFFRNAPIEQGMKLEPLSALRSLNDPPPDVNAS